MNFFNKKNLGKLAPLFLIIILGVFLRLYRHADFLHFELDQARDSIIISDAYLHGPGELPLLGPRAAGTMLRLGPLFYYLEYLSSLLFGNSPSGMDGIFVLFSILAIPACYLFLGNYFSSRISLFTTAIFSVSLFLVTYGKFAWNPNSLALFGFIFLGGLLLSFKKTKSPTYLYLLALGFSFGIQLHFLVFLAYPAVVFLFLLWKFFSQRSKAKEVFKKFVTNKHFWGALALVVFLNFPVIINEFLTGGANLKELVSAVGEKTSRGEDRGFGEKLVRNLQEYANGYLLIISGSEKMRSVGIEFFPTGSSKIMKSTCKEDCRLGLPYLFFGLIFFLGGIWLLFSEFISLLKSKDQKDFFRKDFLILNFILLFVLFFGFLSAAFNFPPRFLLASLPTVFVFLALWFKFLAKAGEKLAGFDFFKKIKTILVFLLPFLLVSLLFLTNIYFNIQRLKEQASAHTKNSPPLERDLVLKEDFRFTFLQQRLITDWIVSQSSYKTVFVSAPSKYYRSLTYLLTYQKEKDGRSLGSKPPCLEADFFVVMALSNSSLDFLKKGEDSFIVSQEKQFGTFMVYKLAIKNPKLIKKTQCVFKKEAPDSKAVRYLWKEVIPESKKRF
jgi:hypothetical protein